VREPERDDLLWELPRAEEQDDRPAPVDGDLRAYRAGTLPAGEATRLEWHLAGSRRGRERLAELAGIAFGVSGARPGGLRRLVPVALALAAILALALLLVLQRRDPALPVYAVRVEGLAGERAEAGDARALAGGAVRVRIEPEGEARAGVRFAAYRLERDTLVRLEEPTEVTSEASRGSAVLTARAGRLVGERAGTRPFFVVVSEQRRGLPPRVAVAGSDPEQSLRRAGAGRVHRVSLTIVEAREDEP
jgi:hypothetical protein